MSHREKEREESDLLFWAVPGVSQCTHIDFLYGGSKALDGWLEGFLRAKAEDVCV